MPYFFVVLSVSTIIGCAKVVKRSAPWLDELNCDPQAQLTLLILHDWHANVTFPIFSKPPCVAVRVRGEWASSIIHHHHDIISREVSSVCSTRGRGRGSDVGPKNSSRRNVARNFQLEILVYFVVSFLNSVKFTEIEQWNNTPGQSTVSPDLPQSLDVSNLPPTFGVAPTSGPAPTFGRNLYHF